MLEYLDAAGAHPFRKWFDRLDAYAAAKVTVATIRMATGNFGDSKSVGGGVIECRIDLGAGFRIYFGRDGDNLVILLSGGTKKSQRADIDEAKRRWPDYKKRSKTMQGI